VTGRARVGRVVVSDRNRAEILEGFPQAPIRYRNRLTLDWQPLARPKWHAFLSDEAFYDFSAHAWTQNRFQAGVGKHLAERWSLDIYYLLRNVRAAQPGQVNVVGTTLTFRIR
jgi:hypothetical protein